MVLDVQGIQAVQGVPVTEPETPQQKAERIGLTFFVEGDRLHVLDGGKRGYRDYEGWTYDGGTSSREATEEEIELWRLIP